jgi:hypothetical protein
MDMLTVLRSHLYPAVVTVTTTITTTASSASAPAETKTALLWIPPIQLTIHPISCTIVKVKDVPFTVQKEPDPIRPDRQRTPPIIAIIAKEGTLYFPQRSDSTFMVTPTGWMLLYPTYTVRWDRQEQTTQ